MREILAGYTNDLKKKLNDFGVECDIRYSGEKIVGIKSNKTVVDLLVINYGRTEFQPEVVNGNVVTWYEGNFDMTFYYLKADVGIEEKIENAVIEITGNKLEDLFFYSDGLNFRYMHCIWGEEVMAMTTDIKVDYVKRVKQDVYPIASGADIEKLNATQNKKLDATQGV